MVDTATYARFEEVREHARRNGLSLVEALDHQGLLWTVDRELAVKLAVLDDLLRRLELQSPNKLMSFYVNRSDGTAGEMLEAVKMWFDAVSRHIAEGTLGDI